MKKLVSLLTSLVLFICLGGGMTANAAPSDDWINNDAVVSKEVLQLLNDRAGFTAYISTNIPVSMNPENVSTFTIEEQTDSYFIGSFYSNSNKILVTKEGVIASYSPKKVAHTSFENMLHTQDVIKAVKIFVGPTIKDVNYLNFESLSSNRAFAFYNRYEKEITIPQDAIINAIAYSYSSSYTSFPEYYGTILPFSLQAGVTHTLNNRGAYIDNVRVFTNSTDIMTVYYTSNSPITTTAIQDYNSYKLSNKFRTSGGVTPTPPNEKKELQNIKLSMDATDMKPNSSQTISVIGTYTDGTQAVLDGSAVNWTVSNSAAARVVNGRLDALASGTTAIFANLDGKTAVANVTVHDFKVIKTKYNEPVNKKWTIATNQTVNAASVNTDTVTVTDSKGNNVPVRYSTSEGSITVTPVLNYKSGESYTLWVRNINSASGKALHQQTKMEFTTK